MANAIELAKSYVPLLDEVYAREVLTSDLDGAPELVQQGANANELIIPMMDMQGLADYSRNSGYVQGDVTLKNETVKCNFDRGRMFWVDSMDDLETAGIAFGRLASARRRRPWPMARPWLLRCAPPPPPWMRMRSRKATGTCTSRLRCTA